MQNTRCALGIGVQRCALPISGDVGGVEATVLVFLDDARLGHGAKALTDASLQHGAVQHGLQEAETGGWGLASTRASRRLEMHGSRRVTAPGPQPLLPHQPMYCPPFAARFAPVIQLASSGMKKLTA